MELPARTRRNVRDAWEAQQPDLEHQLTATLGGVPWTISVDPPALFAQAPSDAVRARLGACITNYVQGALYQLGRYAAELGAVGVRRLNAAAGAHVLALEVEAPLPASSSSSSSPSSSSRAADDHGDGDETAGPCCRGSIAADGRLVVLIDAPRMGLNPVDALAPAQLERALAAAVRLPLRPSSAAAPPAPATLAPATLAPVTPTPATPTPAAPTSATPTPAAPTSAISPRTSSARDLPRLPHLLPRSIALATSVSITNQYSETISEVHSAIASMLHLPADAVELDPNFLETYHALMAVKRKLREPSLPAWMRKEPDAGYVNWPLPFPMPAQLDAQLASWETRLGGLVRAYFQSVADRMLSAGFAADELLCGGFLAAVPRRRIAFRLVEAVPDGQYSDVTVENGVLYLETTVNGFGRRVDRTADKLVERLGIVNPYLDSQ